MKNISKMVFVIIGTMIGAGFASGKEIYTFFGRYELCGLLGITLSGCIVGILINKVLKIIYKENIETYNEFLNYILKNKKIKLVGIFNYIINIFLLISFYIMMAGFIAYFKQKYNLAAYITGTIACFICYIVLSKNIEGVIKISTICVPIIILFIVNIGVKNLDFGMKQIGNMNFTMKLLPNSIISGILYASYNSILLFPVIISLKKYLKKDNIYLIGILISNILIILGILVYIILLKGNIEIMQFDLPLVYIINKFGKRYEYFYGIIIIISIFTSIVSAGYSFLKNCSKTQKQYQRYLSLICISSIFIANIGFSELVNLLYPILGFLGIIQIYYILKRKI